AEPVEHDADPVEAHVDLLRVERLEPREPLREGRETLRHSDQAVDSAGAAAGSGRRISFAISDAMSSRALRLSTIMSRAPFSSKNSARWKPTGKVSFTVCSITRGPAKPISEPGSAMFTSPSRPMLADTPPMV